MGRWGPLEDFLGPVHAHAVVHPAVVDHLELRGVPEIVVRAALLHFFEGVERGARVTGMLAEGFGGPVGGAVKGIVIGNEFDEVYGELAPADELAEEDFTGSSGGFALLYCALCGEGNSDGADVAEVQVWREATGAVELGMVAFFRIRVKQAGDEVFKAAKSGVRSACEGVDRLDGAVEACPALCNVALEIVAEEILWNEPGVSGFEIGLRDEVCGQMREEARLEDVKRVKVFVEET